jgi:hypothetical protein
VQVRAVPDLPDLPPEALAPEGGEERSGRGGVVLHLMGKKRVLSGPYRTANLQLDVFAWSTPPTLHSFHDQRTHTTHNTQHPDDTHDTQCANWP